MQSDEFHKIILPLLQMGKPRPRKVKVTQVESDGNVCKILRDYREGIIALLGVFREIHFLVGPSKGDEEL